jgi:hypothetical protein
VQNDPVIRKPVNMKTPDVSVQESVRRKSEVVLDEDAVKGS